MAQLPHQNVVKLVGAFFDAGRSFVVLEFAHNGSLLTLMAKNNVAMPWDGGDEYVGPSRLRFAVHTARGLSLLHSHRLICRSDNKVFSTSCDP